MSAESSMVSPSTSLKVQQRSKVATSTLGMTSQSNLENTITGPTPVLSATDSLSQKKPSPSSQPGAPVKSLVVVPTSVRVDDIYDTKIAKPFVCKLKSVDIDALTLVLNDWRTEQFNYLQRKFTS